MKTKTYIAPCHLAATSFCTCISRFEMKAIGFHFETLRNSKKPPAFSYQRALRTCQLRLIKFRETPHHLSKQMATVRYIHESKIPQDP